MSDFIYGNVNINVEKATYIPKDWALYSYGSLEYLRKPIAINNVFSFYRETSIRYSKPVLLDSSWNIFWNMVRGYSKFGSEFDYRDKYVKYKKTSLR